MAEKKQSGNGNPRGSKGETYLRTGRRRWFRPSDGSAAEDPLHTVLVAINESLMKLRKGEWSERRILIGKNPGTRTTAALDDGGDGGLG